MIYYPDTNERVTRQNFMSRGADLTWTWDIEGRAEYSLKADTIAGVTVEARLEGDVSYTDIETTPIPLDDYIGTRQPFEFRITPDTITEDQRKLIRIYCGK